MSLNDKQNNTKQRQSVLPGLGAAAGLGVGLGVCGLTYAALKSLSGNSKKNTN